MPLPKEQFLPSGAKLDLAKRQAQYLRGGAPEVFKEAAKETYDNPLVNAGIGFAPVLGDLQAAGETVAALRRGAPWQETAGYAAGMLPFVPMIGKTVWHGSPHTFDNFDMSKVGTGEGAQAYGHGLYLAEARPTAEEYANILGKEVSFKKNPLIKNNELVGSTGNPDLDNRLLKNYGDINATKSDLEHDLRYFSKNKPEVAERVQNMIKHLNESNVAVESAGQLYKVDLPDEQIAKMLDYDLPLSQQSESIKKVFANPGEIFPEGYFTQHSHRTGRDIYLSKSTDVSGDDVYKALIKEKGSPEAASAWLNQQGIPGIQYLDQASRGAGEGTRNYVVFDDKIPQILERNSTPIVDALRSK